MAYIKWDDKDSVGVKIIDDQHKHFIGLLNALYNCLKTKNVDKLSDVIKDVTSYADYHFKTEEKYFDKFNYDAADEHKAVHKKMQLKVASFVNKKGSDPIAVGFDLLYFMELWFLIHFKGADKKFAKLFNEHGLK